jgi:putative FmdB family regulatory protein
MPMYDYQCPSCSHQFEVRQGFSDEPYAVCPRCEAVSRRVFHPVPIIYKGTGFYTTDYARKSYNGSGSDQKESSTSGAAEKVPTAAAGD